MQQTDTDERWYVQFDSGEVRLMTLEELDGAFEAGEVHANTYVIQVGETQWQTLSDVAGLEEEEEEPAQVVPPAPTYSARPAYGSAPPAHGSAPPPYPQRAPVDLAPTAPAPVARPAVAAAAGGWPPLATRTAPQSTWPPAATNTSSSGYNLGPQSTIPVVNDLDLDFDGRSFKSGRKTALIAAFAAIPVLGGGGYALTRLDVPPPAPIAAAAPAPTTTATPWAGPTPTPAPTQAAPTPPPAEPKTESASTGRLSDDMKKALLATDSLRAPKSKARAAAPARRAAPSKGGSSVFKAGGSVNDPLNSKL